MYFSQFGQLEHAEVMKDRYTGKSRGFGFVTFTDSGAAQRAMGTEHSIDGRRCEAKLALPKVRLGRVMVGWGAWCGVAFAVGFAVGSLPVDAWWG